jgi:ParB family chromosome partitioning protein
MALEPDYFKNLANAQKSFLEHTANRLNVEMIDINLLSADPNQPRKNFDVEALNELAEDIKQKGLIQAIIVRKDPGNIGKYIVVAGERRLKACLLAGLEKIKCEINDSYSDVDLGYVQMSENIKRDELKFYEMAEFIISRVEKGEKQNFIAEKLGMNKANVSRYLCWQEAPIFLKEAKDSFMSIRVFYDLVNLAKENEDIVNDFVKSLLEEGKTISKSDVAILKKRIEAPEESDASVSESEIEMASSDTTSDGLNSIDDSDSSSAVEESTSEDANEDVEESLQSEFDETVPFNESEDEAYSGQDQSFDADDTQEGESIYNEDDISSDDSAEDVSFVEDSPKEEGGFKKMKLSKVYTVGTVDGREARLRIDLKPNTDGFLVVEWEDSSLEEVMASSFVINRIFEE